jgi:hypothetical protein
LRDAQTMLEWAKTMTWKGVNPIVELIRTNYEKGVTPHQTSHAQCRGALGTQSRATKMGHPYPALLFGMK